MRSTVLRYSFKVVMLLGVLVQVSCNDAATGFNAEFGADVALSEIKPISPATTDQLATLTVGVTHSDGSPANSIQVVLSCGQCTFFDKAAGEDLLIPDLTRLQAVANPYVVKTGDRGEYQVVVRFSAPANLGVATYTAVINADIGVAQTSTTVSID